MELKTNLDNLMERIEIEFPDVFLVVADQDLVKKDGSCFFSKKEVMELDEILEKSGTGWRLPTLVELKFITAFVEYNEGLTDALSGDDLLQLFGADRYAGKELISGTVRARIDENATYYWSDPSVAGGVMKISTNGASFELEHQVEVSEQYGGFYDHPDSEKGCCVRLVREI